MIPTIKLIEKEQQLGNTVIIVPSLERLPAGLFSASEKRYIRERVTDYKEEVVSFNRLTHLEYVYVVKEEPDLPKRLEAARKAGDKVAGCLNSAKAKKVTLFDPEGEGGIVLAFAEGMALGSYQFLKYMKDREKENTLKEIEVYTPPPAPLPTLSGRGRGGVHLNILLDAVARCRDLINEPNSYLTATVFAREAEKMAKESGARAEVMNKQKIAALKMGGLLGVNQGSLEPPTFTVMEWKPADAVNDKPLVLVGKGIVYDSGGMNLKPGDSMRNMKDDMSGAGAVAAAVYAIAKAGLPVHVVGLMPATDNRPGPRAFVSSDIITMHDGTTVEVIDTDAEGRLILADALSYARRFDPMLVIDLATLTGAAVRAFGKFGAAAMQSKAVKELELLKQSGFAVHERLVEIPAWDEYGDLIKSDIADLKNLGPPEAGMITAGKFLEKFTGYPYIHLDIAGPAFLDQRDSYRGQGGTGFGVRLLFEFAHLLTRSPF